MEEIKTIAENEQKEPQVEEVDLNPQTQDNNSCATKNVKERFQNYFKGGKNSPCVTNLKAISKRWFIDGLPVQDGGEKEQTHISPSKSTKISTSC